MGSYMTSPPGVFKKRKTFTGATITVGAVITIAHGLGVTPDPANVGVMAECITTDLLWSVGDIVPIQIAAPEGSTGGNGTSSRGVVIYTDATNIYCLVAYGGLRTLIKSGASMARNSAMSATKWNLNFQVLE